MEVPQIQIPAKFKFATAIQIPSKFKFVNNEMLAVDIAKSALYLKQFNVKTRSSEPGSIHTIQATEVHFLLSDKKIAETFSDVTLLRLDFLLKQGISHFSC